MAEWMSVEPRVVTEAEFEEIARTARFEPTAEARRALARSGDPELMALVGEDEDASRAAIASILRKMLCVVPDPAAP